MSSEEPRKLVSLRDAAKRLDITEQILYRARERGTIVAAKERSKTGGVCFEEAELERWAANRERLKQLGRPKGTVP